MINHHDSLRRIWNSDRMTAGLSIVYFLLLILSMPYVVVTGLRNYLYDRGILRARKLPCPVLSIGNISVGGTGKTPMVILLARMLKDAGYRPAILSRGYGRKRCESFAIVSDGRNTLVGPLEGGDEPYLISQLLPDMPVIVGPSRFRTGEIAIEKFGANILILDDAFQHRRLYRDIDIVLLEAHRPFGSGRLLPCGKLREAPKYLRRADIIVMTGTDDMKKALTLPASLQKIFNEVEHHFYGFRKPKSIIDSKMASLPLDFLKGKRIYAFAGIGNPMSFCHTIETLGVSLAGFLSFPDHHFFSSEDIAAITGQAKLLQADIIITTEKDGVRLREFPDLFEKIFFLRIEMNLDPGGEEFRTLILNKLKTGRCQNV